MLPKVLNTYGPGNVQSMGDAILYKNTDTVTSLINKLSSSQLTGFELLARLGYDSRLDVTYSSSELMEVVKENKIITARHFFYARDTSPSEISLLLEKTFSEIKSAHKICEYNPRICSEYALATQKVLEALPSDDSDETHFTDIYFVVAHPHISPPGINGHHFESKEIRMFLLKYVSDKSH